MYMYIEPRGIRSNIISSTLARARPARLFRLFAYNRLNYVTRRDSARC